MRNKTLIKCLGMALAVSLALVGCDSGSDNVTIAGGAGATTGGTGTGGAAAGTGTGTGSAGLTGATFGGGGVTTTGTTGTGTTGTTGTGTTGTGTTGTTGGTSTGGNFGNPVVDADTVASLNNPTQMVRIGNRIFFVDGFNLGQSNGRLMSTTATTNGFTTPVEITPAATSTVMGFTNPWGIATDGSDIFISVGFNATQESAILRVTDLTANTGVYSTISASAGFMNNPAFLLIANANGAEYCYWSEYSSANSSGRVRRARTDGTGAVDVVVNDLEFPAGIATDGTNLMICDSGGGANGQVIRVPLSFSGTTLSPATATIVAPAAGEQAIVRPFDIVYDGSNGFFFTEGNAIEGSPLVATGQGNGAVRFVPNGTTTATIISNGLTNAAGITATPLAGNNVGLLFTESIAINGRVLRRVVNLSNVTNAAPDQIDIGLNRPIDVLIADATVPIFVALVNYNGGQANGLLNAYAPTAAP